MIVLTLLGWSSIPLFLRSFIHEIDFWTANGWRYAFSAVLWAPVIALGLARRTLPPDLWRAALLPSLFNALGQAAFAAAPYYVEPGLMTFALRVQIVFVTIAAAVLFPVERRIIRSGGFLLGLAMVVLGTIGTVTLNPGGLGGGTGLGVFLSVGSGLLFAGYAVSVRHAMHGINPLVAFAAISQYTAVLLAVPMLLFADRAGLAALDLPAPRFTLLLLSSLIGIGLGHTFYYFSIARLGVAVSSGVIQLQPFIVAAASFPLFGERLTAGQWGSGAVAIVGAAIILYAQDRVGRVTGSRHGG